MGAAWLLRRLVASVAIIFAVVTFVFMLIHAAPGKPCAGQTEDADPVVCAQLNRQFGLINLGISMLLPRTDWELAQ